MDEDATLARILAGPDARYLLLCRECRTGYPYQRDCKTVKAARNGNAKCSCEATLEVVKDYKNDHE